MTASTVRSQEKTASARHPFGFSDRNPAINLAPQPSAGGDHCHR
jgi:hypothetical protein